MGQTEQSCLNHIASIPKMATVLFPVPQMLLEPCHSPCEEGESLFPPLETLSRTRPWGTDAMWPLAPVLKGNGAAPWLFLSRAARLCNAGALLWGGPGHMDRQRRSQPPPPGHPSDTERGTCTLSLLSPAWFADW